MREAKATRDTWIQMAEHLAVGEALFLYPRGDLTQADAYAALEAQYGPNLFDTWQHGQALRIVRGKSYNEGQRFKIATRALSPDVIAALTEEELASFREIRKAALNLWRQNHNA